MPVLVASHYSLFRACRINQHDACHYINDLKKEHEVCSCECHAIKREEALICFSCYAILENRQFHAYDVPSKVEAEGVKILLCLECNSRLD